MAKNLALNSRKWHQKNLIGENGGERKINPSANPVKESWKGVHMYKGVGVRYADFISFILNIP